MSWTLAQPLSPSAKLSARRLFRLFWGFSHGIESFHAKGLIHCDIKPENFATVRGKQKILDLGCVRLIKNAKKHPERIGTWKYMAPEVRERKLLDIRADVYSFGVTFRELCPDRHLEVFGPFMVICIGILGWWWFNQWLTRTRNDYADAKMESSINVLAHVQAGIIQYNSKNYEKAVFHLETAISHREFETLNCPHQKVYRILAECYRDGKGVVKDHAKCRLYERRRENRPCVDYNHQKTNSSASSKYDIIQIDDTLSW